MWMRVVVVASLLALAAASSSLPASDNSRGSHVPSADLFGEVDNDELMSDIVAKETPAPVEILSNIKKDPVAMMLAGLVLVSFIAVIFGMKAQMYPGTKPKFPMAELLALSLGVLAPLLKSPLGAALAKAKGLFTRTGEVTPPPPASAEQASTGNTSVAATTDPTPSAVSTAAVPRAAEPKSVPVNASSTSVTPANAAAAPSPPEPSAPSQPEPSEGQNKGDDKTKPVAP